MPMSLLVSSAARSASLLDALDDDALVEVLRAARTSRMLALLASTNWQLCTLARSRVLTRLFVRGLQPASLLLSSRVLGRAPFSGCTELWLTVEDAADTRMATPVLEVAAQWTALRQLDITVKKSGVRGSWTFVEDSVAAALRGLPSLQQLHKLDLCVPAFGSGCAEQVAQIAQLTALVVCVTGDAPVDAAADLQALTGLTNLAELWVQDAFMVQPAAAVSSTSSSSSTAAAAAAGPSCLPSSLTYLCICDKEGSDSLDPGLSPYWHTHLAWCPQLQQLELEYRWRQHGSAHPAVIVSLCAQHLPQLRMLHMDNMNFPTTWESSLPGLPDAVAPVEGEWHPDAALASLTRLESLGALDELHISSQADWRQLEPIAALTHLRGVHIHCVPLQLAVTSLRLVSLEAYAHLGGRGLRALLHAFPNLERAAFSISQPLDLAAVQPAGTQRAHHPCLRELKLKECSGWGNAAAAAAELDALGGILSGVSQLELTGWPCGYSSNPAAGCGLPALSMCTGLVSLHLDCTTSRRRQASAPCQEDFLSMLRPLQQLTSLKVGDAPLINARSAFPLKLMLPRLQRVELDSCGDLMPLAPRDQHATQQQQYQRERQLLETVTQLLQPGLSLVVW